MGIKAVPAKVIGRNLTGNGVYVAKELAASAVPSVDEHSWSVTVFPIRVM